MVTPSTTITFCNVPFKNTYKDIVDFSNQTAQLNYFNGLSNKRNVNNCTYIRHDNYIQVPLSVELVEHYNYLYYLNTGFTTKYHFAFITKCEYVNENCTRVYIELDVWQTYQFDITFNRCLVEREHVNDDTIGKHTIPENLEHGEYICYRKQYEGNDLGMGSNSRNRTYVIGGSFSVSYNSETNQFSVAPAFGSTPYSGTLTGIRYYATNKPSDILAILDAIANSNNVTFDDVEVLFESPQWVVWNNWLDQDRRGEPRKDFNPNTNDIYVPYMLQIGNNETGTYTPKNNKLYTKDYCYLYIDNGGGNTIDYAFENFKVDTITEMGQQVKVLSFTEYSTLTPGCSIKLVPNNYKGVKDPSYGLTLGKYPTLSWSKDAYTNWLTQQGINSPIGKMNQRIKVLNMFSNSPNYYSSLKSKQATSNSMIGGITGANVGANIGLGIVSNLAGIYGEEYQHSISPTGVEGNINSGDVNSVSGFTRFSYNYMSIKPEYAKVIDEYFSAFGYKVNELKVPNRTGRRYWNYIKCSSSNITGSINQEHLDVINEIFMNGVTIWHNANNMYNYSLNNTIV